MIALDPHTVGEVLGDARTIAQATGCKDAAVDLVRERVRADRPGPARGAAAPGGPAWSRSSGSIRRSPPATGSRS